MYSEKLRLFFFALLAAGVVHAAERVQVPAGPFQMGCSLGDPECDKDEGPPGGTTVDVPAFAIDDREVTVAHYGRCMEAGRCDRPKDHERNNYCNLDAPGRDDHPINCVDWDQALAYCEWVGGRLPLEAEWEKAARAGSLSRYPWGQDASCEQAILDEVSPAESKTEPDGCYKDSTSPVGSRPSNALGLYGMHGNAGEWIANWYGPDSILALFRGRPQMSPPTRRDMNLMKSETRWHVFEDAFAVAQEAARRVLAAAQRAILARGVFRIVLAGGSTPRNMHRLLAAADTDWTLWQVYFGDERCLPPHEAERNSVAAKAAWLDHVPVPKEHLHAIPAELGAEDAAAEYAPLVEDALPFDVVTLGLGEDGHTASLFPGQAHPGDELVHAVHGAPKPPPDRVSLSSGALGQAREILILVSGAGKRDAVAAWCAGVELPVATVGGEAGVDVLIDRAAFGDSR